MWRTQRVLSVVLGALTWAGGRLAAQDSRPGLVTGQVVDSTGVPVPGAIVQATALGSHAIRVSHTSDQGRYGFRFETTEEAYEILVRSPGLVPARFVLHGGTLGLVVGNVQLIPLAISPSAIATRPVSSWFSGNQL